MIEYGSVGELTAGASGSTRRYASMKAFSRPAGG
jgi:hypothetical protein